MPIGNGRLGAMVFGYASRERWQLNEDSVWYGGPRDRNPTDALRYLPKLRQLLDEGRLQEAENLAQTAFVGMPEMQRHYEPAGQVNLIFPHQEDRVVNYRRDLDLEQAVTTVSYELDGVQYFRELFSSYPANVIAAKLTASVSGKLSFQMRLIRHTGMPMTSWAEIPPGDIDTCLYMDTISVVDNCLVLRAITGGNGVGLALTATVRVDGGEISESWLMTPLFLERGLQEYAEVQAMSSLLERLLL
jgi:alpha-L-fucosidase 2